MNDFKLEFSLSDARYPTALRLVVGAILSSKDVDIDTIEDFKVAACESVLIIKSCGYERATVTFSEDGGCQVLGLGGEPKASDNEFSLMLINALLDNCQVEKQGVAVSKVILKL